MGNEAEVSDRHPSLEGLEQKGKKFGKQGTERMSFPQSGVWILPHSFLSPRPFPTHLTLGWALRTKVGPQG